MLWLKELLLLVNIGKSSTVVADVAVLILIILKRENVVSVVTLLEN